MKVGDIFTQHCQCPRSDVVLRIQGHLLCAVICFESSQGTPQMAGREARPCHWEPAFQLPEVRPSENPVAFRCEQPSTGSYRCAVLVSDSVSATKGERREDVWEERSALAAPFLKLLGPP